MITQNNAERETENDFIMCGYPTTLPIIGRLMRFRAAPSLKVELYIALNQYVLSASDAEGNIMAEAYYQEDDDSILWVIERWSEARFLDNNEKKEPMLNIIALRLKDGNMPVEHIYFMDLLTLPNQTYRRMPNEGDDPYTVMFFVNTQEGSEENFKSIYHSSMPALRSDPGILIYQLFQDLTDDTKFITYEKFRSRSSFEDHLKSLSAGPVVGFLQNSLRNPSFEQGLQRLIEFAPLYRIKSSNMNVDSVG